jgi:hypothetical protein
VFTKDQDGEFREMNKHSDYSFAERVGNHLKKSPVDKTEVGNGGCLVYVESQEVLFDEEISTVTYFKDITFGVLYERTKA